MMYPGTKESVLSSQKEQASNIVRANIEDIWRFIPILKSEVNSNGVHFGKDYTKLVFRNGSVLDIVVVGQGSRGLRKNSLVFEELCQMDKHREIIGEVILPLMANNRIGADGKINPYEPHKQKAVITTASSRQSYAWEMLQETMFAMAKGESAFVIGNDYTLPVMFDQLDEDYINEVRDSPSMNPLQFAREYMSIYTGSSDNSLVQLKDLEKCRVLNNAEFEAKKGNNIYIISVDVARSEQKQHATTAIAIFKLMPRGNGTYIRHLINIHTYKGNMHFEDQSIYIKELVDKYRASMVVVDGNGLGRGLIDYLVKEDKYPSYSVVNDRSYDKYKLPNSLPLVFNMMSNTKQSDASDIHNNFMNTISNHGLKLLVDERVAKEEIKEKDPEKLAKTLLPYIETGLFIDEVLNLKYEAKGNKTSVKRISKQMEKDRYSAVSYGLYYIYLLEQKNQAKNKRNIESGKKFLAVKKPKYKVW